MKYEYRTGGDFPCKYMDLEAMGDYQDVVLQVSPYETKIKQTKKCLTIYIFAPQVTEAEAIKQIARALKIKQSQIIFY